MTNYELTMHNRYTLSDLHEFIKMEKRTGTAQFIPKRSQKIKNKLRKKRKGR